MKSYADFLQEFIGESGILKFINDGTNYTYTFIIEPTGGGHKLLSVGMDYAEIECDKPPLKFVIPLSLLVIVKAVDTPFRRIL